MRTNPFLGPSGVAAALLLSLCAAAAWAQYPNRPIRLLVPNPPGGATDTIARVIAPRLGEALGQPVVVENRPGSNGNLSSELAARAAPDGYTLLLGQDSQIVISPHLYANLPVDTLKDLTPVATLITTQMVLGVNPALPVTSLQQFLEYARRAKPPLAYASIGNGSQHHLTMEMLKVRAGIDLVHVPYKGGGPATFALLAGDEIDAGADLQHYHGEMMLAAVADRGVREGRLGAARVFQELLQALHRQRGIDCQHHLGGDERRHG